MTMVNGTQILALKVELSLSVPKHATVAATMLLLLLLSYW